MVSVALAMICPLKTPLGCSLLQQATCQFGEAACPALASILHGASKTRKEPHDVDDVSGLSEPYGPDRAVADRRRGGLEIPQPGAAGHLRKTVRPACRGARADLPKLAD